MQKIIQAIVSFFKKLFGKHKPQVPPSSEPPSSIPPPSNPPPKDEVQPRQVDFSSPPDPLIERIRAILSRLASLGWKELFAHHGLDIEAADLASELNRTLSAIDRSLAGFEDFHPLATRAVEPGKPEQSLLYHALASSRVKTKPDGSPLLGFATAEELDLVENFIYADGRSLADLQVEYAGQDLAVVVFAYGYRPGAESIHRQHADVCFSRTGVARVGTAEAFFDAAERGFTPIHEQDDRHTRVLPAHYAPFISVRQKGNPSGFGPMRAKSDDDQQDFWVPVKKLFPGTECLPGMDLQVGMDYLHVNEKLRRLHLVWDGRGGWSGDDLNKPPFRMTEGLAEMGDPTQYGNGWLVPVAAPLCEPAEYNGQPLVFTVPENSNTLSSSLYISGRHAERHAPEYVHARTKVNPDGSLEDLNVTAGFQRVESIVAAGGYQALHYIDRSCDGWIKPRIPELERAGLAMLPAYSVVTSPDFFPVCDQRELMEWFEGEIDGEMKDALWWTPPYTLSDERLAPNIQLPLSPFTESEAMLKTMTAVLGSASCGQSTASSPAGISVAQTNFLPDSAAGVFAPGWDVSRDKVDHLDHLASYGLGSPFPEDAKLCAALSTFWPAAAPDVARVFEPNPTGSSYPTVIPLTDQEIGMIDGNGWDGVAPPQAHKAEGYVEFPVFERGDYVLHSLEGRFRFSALARVDANQFRKRMESLLRCYRALGAFDPVNRSKNRRLKAEWGIYSFRKIDTGDPAFSEYQQAMAATGTALDQDHLFRYEMFRHGEQSPEPGNPHRVRVAASDWHTLFSDGQQVIFRKENEPWTSSSASLT